MVEMRKEGEDLLSEQRIVLCLVCEHEFCCTLLLLLLRYGCESIPPRKHALVVVGMTEFEFRVYEKVRDSDT